MRETLENLISYLRNPILKKDPNKNILHRVKVLFILLLTSLCISFFISIVIGILHASGFIQESKHVFDDISENFSGITILFLAAIFAPVVEEAIFRAPLTLFKNPKYFRSAFYGSAVVFGYIHQPQTPHTSYLCDKQY